MADPDPVTAAERRDGMVAAWLRFAAVDLAASDALLALDHDDIDPWVIAFHAQQAAEKAAKALLLSHGIDFALTHDLATLIGQLPADIAGLVDPELAALTVYAVGVRYPTASWDPMAMDDGVEHADAVSAVDVAPRRSPATTLILQPSSRGCHALTTGPTPSSWRWRRSTSTCLGEATMLDRPLRR